MPSAAAATKRKWPHRQKGTNKLWYLHSTESWRQLSESTRPFSLDIGPPKCEKKQTAEWQSAIGQPYCECLNLTAIPMSFLSVDAVKCKSENEKDTCQVYDCGGLGWGRGVFP